MRLTGGGDDVMRKDRQGRVSGWRQLVLLGVTWMGIGAAMTRGQQGEAPLSPMAKDGTPQFEVATIKPSDPADTSYGFHTQGHRIFVENQTLRNIVAVAYGVHQGQIVEAPAWVDHDRYDIKGVPDLPGYPDMRQMQAMLRKLLEERFQLKLRRDRRELSVYTITVAKGGPKIKKSVRDPKDLPDETGYGQGGQQVVKFTNCAMSDVAFEMQEFMERPVVDTTGLPGRFDFTLTWTPSTTPVGEEAATAPGIFTAVQEQLGLRLQPTKMAADVLVMEHVERPSAD